MAQFARLVAVLSLCVLAAVVNSQDNQPPPVGTEICTHYTQGGSLILDMPKVFDMVMIEFGREIQTLNPMLLEEWMRVVDDDHDRRLNMVECTKLIQHILTTIKRP